MTLTGAVIFCLAYILGLLCTAVPRGGYGLLALGIVVAIALLLPLPVRLRFLKTGPKPTIWVLAGIIGFLATLYLQFRVPQPGANDISRFAALSAGTPREQVIAVVGKVTSTPRLTRSQKVQFWLSVSQLDEIVPEGKAQATAGRQKRGEDRAARVNQEVTGKLYVTVPLLQATGLHEGERVTVTGKLYKPKPAANPGSFDFAAYLAREGTFAGMVGRQVTWPEEGESGWGLWWVRQKIVRSQVRWLGVPEGPLVSAIALGKQAVDLPYDIRDGFVKVGLAHALAASGAQVSLILCVVLALTKRFSERTQFGCGAGAIAIFVALTGLEASVSRAALMGLGALVGLVSGRKVRPLGSLLVSATLLLLFNPLWIWDLGFQLSFLATLGLLVTVPAIMKRLDWLPVAIASLIAVPLAASVWVLPLQLYVFGVVSPYSILVNVITTPLISVISIGGTLSALAGTIWSEAGSALAWLMLMPARLMMEIVEFVGQLPGNSVATGTISVVQVVGLYVLLGLVWLLPWWHKRQRWWLAFLFAVGLVLVPVWQAQATLFRVTVLATRGEPILVIQDKGKVALINSGDEDTARFTVLPFLQQQGVNKIDGAIATTSKLGDRSGWPLIVATVPVKSFYPNAFSTDTTTHPIIVKVLQNQQGSYLPLAVGQAVQVGSLTVTLLNAEPSVVQLQIREQRWLLLGNLNPSEQNKLLNNGGLPVTTKDSPLEVLWWSGEQLTPYLLDGLQPRVAIAASDAIDLETAAKLSQGKTQLYLMGRDGALQWTPGAEFETRLDSTENETPLL